MTRQPEKPTLTEGPQDDDADIAKADSPPQAQSIPMPQTRRIDVDIWLQRLSHFSQFALFLVTLWALYFTVVPLYEKALLEEAIARREIELRELNAEIDERERQAYISWRSSATSAFMIYAAGKCTGLLDPPEQTVMLDDVPPPTERWLEYDVSSCLEKRANEFDGLADLREADRAVLASEIGALRPELDALRQTAQTEYKGAAERVRAHPDQYRMLPFGEDLVRNARELEPTQDLAPVILMFKTDGEEIRVATDYLNAVRTRLLQAGQEIWSSETTQAN